MKSIIKFLPLLGLLFVFVACDDEISYDQFGVVPIIEDLEADVAINERTATVTASATNAETYVIDFGDGTTETTNGTATHTYAAPGLYVIKITARAPELFNISRTINARVQLLDELNFDIAVDPIQTQTVTVTSTAPGATSFRINWGDGSPEEENTTGTFTHTYPAAGGSFSIRVTATDGIEPLSVIQDVVIAGAPREFLVDNDFSSPDALDNFTEGQPDANIAWLSLVPSPTDADNQVMEFTPDVGFRFNNLNFEPVPFTAKKIFVEWKWYPTVTDGGWDEFFNFGLAPNRLKLQITSTPGQVRARPHEDVPALNFMPFAPNEWHSVKLTIDIEADEAEYNIDGEVQIMDLSASDVDPIGQTVMSFGGGGTLSTFYIDDVRISYQE